MRSRPAQGAAPPPAAMFGNCWGLWSQDWRFTGWPSAQQTPREPSGGLPEAENPVSSPAAGTTQPWQATWRFTGFSRNAEAATAALAARRALHEQAQSPPQATMGQPPTIPPLPQLAPAPATQQGDYRIKRINTPTGVVVTCRRTDTAAAAREANFRKWQQVDETALTPASVVDARGNTRRTTWNRRQRRTLFVKTRMDLDEAQAAALAKWELIIEVAGP